MFARFHNIVQFLQQKFVNSSADLCNLCQLIIVKQLLTKNNHLWVCCRLRSISVKNFTSEKRNNTTETCIFTHDLTVFAIHIAKFRNTEASNSHKKELNGYPSSSFILLNSVPLKSVKELDAYAFNTFSNRFDNNYWKLAFKVNVYKWITKEKHNILSKRTY